MAITLNGTTGITTPDLTSDGSLKIDASAPDDSLVVDASGNVGIGTTSPNQKLALASGAGIGAAIEMAGNGNTLGTTSLYVGQGASGDAYVYQRNATQPLVFGTANAERARIDSSGNLLVGTTSSIGGRLQVMRDSTGRIINTRSFNTSNQYHHAFENNSGSLVGSITVTTTSTVYNTSSDYRLKEDWQPMSGAITRLNQLNPVNFAWKLNGSRVDGFLAHEVQDVVPEAITGTKDAVELVDIKDEDGNVTGQEERPVYQGIDQSKLVPLLTAALQEALGKIETLEARVAALEASNV